MTELMEWLANHATLEAKASQDYARRGLSRNMLAAERRSRMFAQAQQLAADKAELLAALDECAPWIYNCKATALLIERTRALLAKHKGDQP